MKLPIAWAIFAVCLSVGCIPPPTPITKRGESASWVKKRRKPPPPEETEDKAISTGKRRMPNGWSDWSNADETSESQPPPTVRSAPPRTTKPVPPPKSRPIVAVFNIEAKGIRLPKKLLIRLSDYLSMKLAATGRYQVVPRDQLKKRLVQQKRKSYKPCYDQTCQIEIGKELAAQKSLTAVVMKLGSKCMLTVVLYDLRRATSQGGASAEGECSEDEIVRSIKSVVMKLAEL